MDFSWLPPNWIDYVTRTVAFAAVLGGILKPLIGDPTPTDGPLKKFALEAFRFIDVLAVNSVPVRAKVDQMHQQLLSSSATMSLRPPAPGPDQGLEP